MIFHNIIKSNYSLLKKKNHTNTIFKIYHLGEMYTFFHKFISYNLFSFDVETTQAVTSEVQLSTKTAPLTSGKDTVYPIKQRCEKIGSYQIEELSHIRTKRV